MNLRKVTCDAFKTLSPLCIKLTTNCTIEDYDVLLRACEKLDNVSLQLLQEYLIFPLRLTLCKNRNEHLNEKCVSCLRFVFSKTLLSSWNLFYDVLEQLFKSISVPDDVSKVSQASEEFKLAVCECVETMILNSDKDILLQMFSPSFHLPLAHALFVLLGLLKNEKSKTLQLAILKTISALVYCNDNLVKDESIKLCAGNSLAAFLPGVSVSLQNIICGGNNQGHAIIVMGLNIFKEFIALTVDDNSVSEISPKPADSEKVKSLPSVMRDSNWVKEIQVRLEIILVNITNIAAHDHWKVRLALAKCAQGILCTCTRNLQNCISALLQVLFSLSIDNDKLVAEAGQDAIKMFQEHINKLDLKSFHTILEEDLFALCSKLVKIHLSGNDNQKLSLLRTMYGYLQLLDKSVNNLLYSTPHLQRFILSMLSLTEFDFSDVNVLENSSISLDCDVNFSGSWPKKIFKHFHNNEIMLRICLIFNLLGQNGNIRLLTDYLLETINEPQYKKQSIFLIIHLIKGATKRIDQESVKCDTNKFSLKYCDDDIIDIIKNILEELLSTQHWEVPISCSVSSLQLSSLSSTSSMTGCKKSLQATGDYNENIFQICLILEAIATFAQVLNLEFRPFVMQVICPVMERAGCSNLVLSQTGKITLCSIAHSCRFQSVTKLILENADYLVNSVIINLNYFPQNFEAAFVFRVALELCDVNILPLFKDCMSKIIKILDYNKENALPMLKVLHSAVTAVVKWFPLLSKSHSKSSFAIKSDDTDLKSTFLEYNSLKQNELKVIDENLTEELPVPTEIKSDDCSETDKNLSLYEEFVTDVLQHCIHLQSSKNLQLCILALDTMKLCVLALKHTNDKLLPLVHNLWSSFVIRFTEDLVIALKAFELLVVLANECGDFIKARTMKSIWLNLLAFLKKQSHVSLSNGNLLNYQLTNSYKFQHYILSEIGNLAKKLDLTEKEIEMLALNCVLYLDQRQPLALQNASKKTLCSLESIDPDALWFHSNEGFSEKKKFLPPHPSLCTFGFV